MQSHNAKTDECVFIVSDQENLHQNLSMIVESPNFLPEPRETVMQIEYVLKRYLSDTNVSARESVYRKLHTLTNLSLQFIIERERKLNIPRNKNVDKIDQWKRRAKITRCIQRDRCSHSTRKRQLSMMTKDMTTKKETSVSIIRFRTILVLVNSQQCF